jgi:hypothetical protein
MDTQRNNPLKQYYRQVKMYLRLPSGTSYYPPGTIDFNDSGEVGIMPMTGQDEMLLKNPDALLNGEALSAIIQSCVPAIKNTKVLLNNDIDALITAIRAITFKDSLENEIACPKCNHINNYKLDLMQALNGMEYLESEYVVNLDNGLSIFLKPYSYKDVLSGLHMQFEQAKFAKAIQSESLSEEDRLKILSNSFKQIAALTFDLTCGSVIKIVDESNNINVTEKEFIVDFLRNAEKETTDKIQEVITQINNIGVKRTFTATCSACSHEWENDIELNPINFS